MPRLNELIAAPMVAPVADWQRSAPTSLFKKGMPVTGSADLERILALPRRKPIDIDSVTARALVELAQQKYSKENPDCQCRKIDPSRTQCITRLLPMQAIVLHEIALAGGLLAHAAAGSGKTLCWLMSPHVLEVANTLLLVPPTLVEQLVNEYRLLAEHFHMPSIVVHQADGQPPLFKEGIGAPWLHVLSYSRLSLPTASDWIDRLSPDAIVADEADAMRIGSSRMARLLRYVSGKPDMTPEQLGKRARTKFCAGTGSLTDKSINDFLPLAALALKYGSPVPLDPMVGEEWGRCIDAVENPCDPGELLSLCEPGEDVRAAFRRRMRETSGCIIMPDNPVQVSGGVPGALVQLDIRERVPPAIPDIVKYALDKVRGGERPDTLAGADLDETLVDALTQAKVAREVSAGFFYYWIFPRGESEPLVQEWRTARKYFNSELRELVMQGLEYLDSPKLCENACRRGWGELELDPKRPYLPVWKPMSWPRWRDVKDKVEPQTAVKWLDEWLAQDAVNWGHENRGIIWYSATAFAERVQKLSGFTLHAGGPKAGERLRAEQGKNTIIASLKSHGRGRDGLQRIFDHGLVTTPPSSYAIWEQLGARTRRRGQKSSLVRFEVYLHTQELQDSLEQALRRSQYVQEILGGDPSLLQGWKP